MVFLCDVGIEKTGEDYFLVHCCALKDLLEKDPAACEKRHVSVKIFIEKKHLINKVVR